MSAVNASSRGNRKLRTSFANAVEAAIAAPDQVTREQFLRKLGVAISTEERITSGLLGAVIKKKLGQTNLDKMKENAQRTTQSFRFIVENFDSKWTTEQYKAFEEIYADWLNLDPAFRRKNPDVLQDAILQINGLVPKKNES